MITKVEIHVEDGLGKLLEQYNEKPRIKAWISSYLKQVQLLEDEIWEVFLTRLLEHADGVHLDKIGKKVGQPRIGTDDDVYKLHIRARIRINISNGQSDDIVELCRLLLQALRFRVYDYYPASFVIDVLDPMVEDPAFVASLIGEARGAGIGHSLHYSFDEEDETFAFSDTDVEQADAFRGMSDTAVDASGGQLISVI
jgi:hypothetical protein